MLQFHLQGKILSVTWIIIYPAQTPSNLSGHWAARVVCSKSKKRTDACRMGKGHLLSKQLFLQQLSAVELIVLVRDYSMLLVWSPVILLVWKVSGQTFF